MKRLIAFLIITTTAIGTVYQGLMFDFEASVVFTVISGLAALLFLFLPFRKEKISIPFPLIAFGLLMLGTTGLAYVNAVNPRANLTSVIQNAAYLLVLFVMIVAFREKFMQYAKTLMWVFALTGFAASMVGLLAITKVFPVLDGALYGISVASFFQYPNTAAIFISASLVFALSLQSSSSRFFMKVFLAAMGNAMIGAILLTRTKGGIVIGLVVILASVFLQHKQNRWSMLINLAYMAGPAFLYLNAFAGHSETGEWKEPVLKLGISMLAAMILVGLTALISPWLTSRKHWKLVKHSTIVMCLILFPILVYLFRGDILARVPADLISRFTSTEQINISTGSRMEFYITAVRLASKQWLTGYGGGGWVSMYQSVADTDYVAYLVHNHYLQVLVEQGVPGFLAFLGFVGYICVSYLKRIIGNDHPDDRTLLIGLFGGFVAFALHAVIDFTLSFQAVMLLFWLLAAGVFIKTAPSATGQPERVESSAIIEWGENQEGLRQEVQATASKRHGLLLAIVLFLVCVVMTSVNARFSIAGYHGENGRDLMADGAYHEAMQEYEQAYRLDGQNAEYASRLSILLLHLAQEEGLDMETKQQRLEASVGYGAQAVFRSPEDPAMLEVKVHANLDAGLPLDALYEAEKLVKQRRCVPAVYELLARMYMDAALQHVRESHPDEAKAVMSSLADMTDTPYAALNQNTLFLKAQALCSMKRFREAEQVVEALKPSSGFSKKDVEVMKFVIVSYTKPDELMSFYTMEEIGSMESTFLLTVLRGVIDANIY